MKNSIFTKHSRLHWITVACVLLFLIGFAIKETLLAMVILGDHPDVNSLMSNVIYMSGAAGIAVMILINAVFHKDLDE